MTGRPQRPWLPAAAVAAALAGLLWTGPTLRSLQATGARLDRRAADLEEILAMEARLLRAESWGEILRRRHAAPLADPLELFERMAPGLERPSVQAPAPEPRGDGLRVFVLRIEFRDIPLATLGAWLAACENLAPPWRAARLRIDPAGGGGAGSARVELELEGVQAGPP